ncbi:MAG: DNA translocase FtsK [Treponema sp.]|uniref:DNA translocase FtsK n=1 Tax=Treponema sp. TaxID=166 RepID=UPI00298EBB04|nr:DNA translocase FtsK [Treponema sp.]MCQ2600923.1 DNA translocase FtsK [Treponema sp.]
MKKYRVVQIIAGIVFFLLAIFFSFGLIFALFDNSQNLTGFTGFIAWNGRLIKDSYGLCSILIPLFFFTVSIFCLILQITFKKCIYISFSLIPFFTAVASEHIYRNSTQHLTGGMGVLKLIFTIVVTLLIMGIEFLLSGIIAERIAFNRRMKNQLRKEAMKEDSDDILYGTTSTQEDDAFDKIMSSDNSENPIDEPEMNSQYIHAFDDVPLYDKNSDFSLTEETPQVIEETVPDTFEGYDEQEETEIIYEERQNQNSMDNEADYDDYEASESDYDYNDDDIEVDIPDYDSIEMNDDSDVVETDLEQTQDGISDVFSQMDKDINEKIDGVESDSIDLSEPEIDEAEPSPDQQFEKELEESQSWQETEEETDFNEPVIEPETTDVEKPTVSVKEAEAKIREEKKSTITKRRGAYKVPTDGLLNQFEDQKYWIIDGKTNEAADFLKETLKEFKIDAEVTGIRKGPVVTMFEILPAPGVKLSKIVALQDNIALRLAASSVRIVAPIPGKRAVGIEVPNANRATVTFRELIEQNLPEYKKMAVPVVLGKDIQGEAQLLDIAKTPHLLIAGSTGSGKSVCVNSIILSILYKRSPQEVKMILVDPKIVELKLYNDIPHLLTPVITEPKKALQSLQYCLCEMERRYALLDGLGVRDIINYNKRVEERHIATEKLPYIVVIIDEFADLMATTGKELESTIARLCAMSRAVGIHLVLATQRPSIDVITGLIKANIPTRIAFMVASKMDSRIIIDQVGAEKLLGRGDMLYASATDPFPVRIQGTFVSDQEVENVVEYVKGYGEPEYIDEEIFVETEDDEMADPGLFGGGEDPLYNKALEIVMQAGKASASYLQRRLSIGYNRAARLIEDMEARGIVGPANGSKPREIIHAV